MGCVTVPTNEVNPFFCVRFIPLILHFFGLFKIDVCSFIITFSVSCDGKLEVAALPRIFVQSNDTGDSPKSLRYQQLQAFLNRNKCITKNLSELLLQRVNQHFLTDQI